MEKKKITDQPLDVEFRATRQGASVLIETTKANKYLGYPSTYAACMAHSQYLTDTNDMNTIKAAGACAAAVERMHDESLKKEEANLQKGYPHLGIPPMATASEEVIEEECQCAKEAQANKGGDVASVGDYQRGTYPRRKRTDRRKPRRV